VFYSTLRSIPKLRRYGMADDELSDLQEQLAEARAELDRLQTAAADSQAQALHFQEQNAETRRQLGAVQAELAAERERFQGLDGEFSTTQAALAAAQEETEALHARLQAAAGKYREALLAAAPELPADLINGETIEEVAASVEQARQTVRQVRERLESQVQAGRVPMGSPPRGAPDLSALSPVEKIRLGLSQR
jgi:predicted  nucleic acid-binding Zn-ribbon protein